jgi:excinuclease ABC subunit C
MSAADGAEPAAPVGEPKPKRGRKKKARHGRGGSSGLAGRGGGAPLLDEAKLPDRVFLPKVKDPIRLRPNTSELFLLARVRDEAHRFANTFHRELRKRSTLRSALEDVPGVGPKRRTQLLRSFGSLRRLREASVEDMAKVPGMSLAAAQAVKQFFSAAAPEDSAGED